MAELAQTAARVRGHAARVGAAAPQWGGTSLLRRLARAGVREEIGAFSPG